MKEKLLSGHYFHIYNRGNNGENLFIEQINYPFFLKKYAEYCYPVLDTYAYCLMKNHFHFLVRVREIKEMHGILRNEGIKKSVRKRLKKREWSPALVSQQLSHCFNGYTQAVNKKYNRTGSLFKRPFERKNINEDDYFCNALCYIHRNPQLHGFINDFRRYPYSSHSAYLLGKKSKINAQESLKRFGGIENFKVAHKEGLNMPEEYRFD